MISCLNSVLEYYKIRFPRSSIHERSCYLHDIRGHDHIDQSLIVNTEERNKGGKKKTQDLFVPSFGLSSLNSRLV